MRTFARLFVLTAVLFLPSAAIAERWTLGVDVDGKHLQGMPISQTQKQLQLLGRDGRLWNIDASRARNPRKVSNGFRSYSDAEMRGLLQKEFGRNYDVSGTGHYLVVHPAGQRNRWAERFEQLYRSMIPYFRVRGMSVREPPFPLVAVVLPSEQHFHRHARAAGARIGPGYLGFYATDSNRILMYDYQNGNSPHENWMVNAATIVHEAAHQTAFNIGIHSRFAAPPRWVCEGLGTMFEARGVYDSPTYRRLGDRVNHEQLAAYKRYFGNGLPQRSLAALAASDRAFRQNITAAYALSWAATFYFAEREPGRLSDYLRTTADRRAFTEYTKTERLRDFAQAFGSDLAMIEARVHRFVAGLW